MSFPADAKSQISTSLKRTPTGVDGSVVVWPRTIQIKRGGHSRHHGRVDEVDWSAL